MVDTVETSSKLFFEAEKFETSVRPSLTNFISSENDTERLDIKSKVFSRKLLITF